MKRLKDKKRPSPSHLFACTELPVAESDRVEISGRADRRQVLVVGVRHILTYSAVCMVFSLHSDFLVVRGEELDCVTYGSGAIRIGGRVHTVSFARRMEEIQ